ncbi:hypothetical protein FRX31_028055 [Thalictrum thalictroides]|uniref:Uncharacterized protein n=1 Tax=Thalictrum thalictroides TaxID=46969 RepID=A0A7J6VCM8_THATH|nr:hypothetical protein FRX31_028055 [Thalictrum thalictroides]
MPFPNHPFTQHTPCSTLPELAQTTNHATTLNHPASLALPILQIPEKGEASIPFITEGIGGAILPTNVLDLKVDRPWNSFIKTIPTSAGIEDLEYIEPQLEEEVLLIEEEILKEGALEWENRVVGFFLDKKLPFTFIKDYVQKKWKLEGSMDIALDGDMEKEVKSTQDEPNQNRQEGRKFFNKDGPSKIPGRKANNNKQVWQVAKGQRKQVVASVPNPTMTQNKFEALQEEGEIEVVAETVAETQTEARDEENTT